MTFRDIDWDGELRLQAHRPWPMPSTRWAMRMSWVDLLFAHYRVDPDSLRKRLPDGLDLDLYGGEAFVGIVPFVMDNVGVGTWPTPSPWARFCELNVRTYVVGGGRPGVWFFSLDAQRRAAVEGARALFHLPYFMADMSCRVEDGRTFYTSQRSDRRLGAGTFAAHWESTSPVRNAQHGTLEHWLTERYCLFSHDNRGRLYSADVHHRMWPLQDVRAVIEDNTVCDAHGLTWLDASQPPILHCVKQLDVVGWWPRLVDRARE